GKRSIACSKLESPAIWTSWQAGHDGAEEPAEVDAHVEDREARIATRTSFRVKVRDHRADVRFQQPDAADDDDQAQVEGRGDTTESKQQVSERDQNAAVPHGASRADQAIRDPTAGQAQDVGR